MPTTLNSLQMEAIAQTVDLDAINSIIDQYKAARSSDRASKNRGWTGVARRACDLQQTLGSIADHARDLGPDHWAPIRLLLCEREVIGCAMRYMSISR
jgi:hypothetical protein